MAEYSHWDAQKQYYSLIEQSIVINTKKNVTNILSAFASLMPLIVIRCFFVAKATDSIVWYPAS